MLTLQAELGRRDLREYFKQAWHIVEPAVDYVSNWHIDAIAEHLMAVTRGEIRNLIINIPPRCMKSLSVAVFWPTWSWIDYPEIQWLFASYAEPLALRDSVKCRRLLYSKWYLDRWGDSFNICGDQNQKAKFENDQGGHRIAIGLGGAATGEGGDIIVVDDPTKAKDSDSEPMLNAAIAFWKGTLSTRGNDPRTVRRVVIMQRLSQRDLTGHILEEVRRGETEFEVLCLPMEYEKTARVTSLGWKDPRKEIGELLWPGRFGQKEVDQIARDLGPRDAPGQLQQRPAPAGGMTFLKAWYATRFKEHKTVSRWLSVDTAMKDSDRNAYSVIETYDMFPDYRIGLSNVWRGKVGFPELLEKIEYQAKRANEGDLLSGVVIEDRVSGTSAVQTLRAAAPDWLSRVIIAFPVGSKGKQYRAQQASVWCQRGCVLLPQPSEDVPWLFAFEDELFNFPGSMYKDQVDAFAQIIIYLEWYLSAYWQGVAA